MSKSIRNVSDKAGAPPGILVHVGMQKSTGTRISCLDYTPEHIHEKKLKPEDCRVYKEKKSVSWINVDGLSETDAVAQIGRLFGLDSLLVEDVLNTSHRPKLEEFDEHLLLIFKMLSVTEDRRRIRSEQLSFVLGKGWLLSFQEEPGDVFDGLRNRIREKKGVVRDRETDFLFYRLVDTVVDHYFFVTEHLSDSAEKLEERILSGGGGSGCLQEIQHLKRQLILCSKSVKPLREAIAYLLKDAYPFVQKSTKRYFRDVYEHLVQLTDTISAQRDLLSNIMDLYLSESSNRMNQVMQILTIISTIFIPLTFIAGVYGMNFTNMPELHWKYGYLMVWTVMLAMIVFMVMFFKRKGWW